MLRIYLPNLDAYPQIKPRFQNRTAQGHGMLGGVTSKVTRKNSIFVVKF
jgi:hypothetical protein